jgi:hypothetical protein
VSELRNIDLHVLADACNVPATKFEHELALLGWNALMAEAVRLAHIARYDKMADQPDAASRAAVQDSFEAPPEWSHMIEAIKEMLPHIAGNLPVRAPAENEHRNGFVYLLYDGTTKLSKIGCTRHSNKKRQKSLMSAHGGILMNVLSVSVKDRRAAEAQCHEHFKEFRTNGEWFNADLKAIIDYMSTKLARTAIDIECSERLAQYIAACELSEINKAKSVLKKSNSP